MENILQTVKQFLDFGWKIEIKKNKWSNFKGIEKERGIQVCLNDFCSIIVQFWH